MERLDNFELEDGAGNPVTATTLLEELTDEELEDLLQPLADKHKLAHDLVGKE